LTVIVKRASQQEARYTARGGGVECCGRCRFFMPPRFCGRIEGPVVPAGWCKYYSREAVQNLQPASTAGAVQPTLDLGFLAPGALPAGLTFTRASTGTYFDSAGVMQTATVNAPRWDYDPVTHALRGLLIEEARTNLLLNSATLVTQNVTTTAVATTLSFQGTGTVTLSGTSTAGPLTGTGANNRVALTFTPTAGTLTCTVSGAVTNANLEAGSFPTSWIPTTGAAATRAIDSMTMPTSPWFTNPAAASFVADVMVPSSTGGDGTYMQFDDGTTNNRMVVNSVIATHSANAFESVGGTTTFSSPALGIIPFGVPFKIGYSTTANARAYTFNGLPPVVNVGSALAPPTVTTLRLGRNTNPTAGSFCMRRARYWPLALAPADLQAVTT